MATVPNHEHPELKKGGPINTIVLPLVVAFITALFAQTAAWYFNNKPKIERGTAQRFLTEYYQQVTNSNTIRAAYNKLTKAFREYPVNDWQAYEKYWRTQKSVTVKRVDEITGNQHQFDAQLLFQSKDDEKTLEETIFSLKCIDWKNSVPSFSCGIHDIQIDNTQIPQRTRG